MWTFLGENWDRAIDIATLLVAILSVAVGAGLFVRHKRNVKDLIYVEQERDDFRRKFSEATARLNEVDPERFIDQVTEAYGKAEFGKAEELSLAFAERQSEAFGKAAEYLTEQRILDSEKHGAEVIEEAKLFAAIGRAAFPESKRLEELEGLAERRARDIELGDPIEALNMEGMSDVELNRLSMALEDDGHYALAEVAARRSVPLAALRTGEESQNFAGAIAHHASTLNRLGAFGDAEGLYRQALEIGKATIGEGHPAYANRLNNLAAVVQAQGRLDEADGLYRQALEIDKATIGEGHPDYAIRLNNVAGLVQAQGRFEEAEGLYRQALEIDKATIGEGHPDYALHLNNLAVLLAKTDRRAEAVEMFEQALAIRMYRLGPEHPNTKATQAALDGLRGDDQG